MDNTIDLGSFKDLDKLTDGYRSLNEEELSQLPLKYRSYGRSNIVIVTVCLDIIWFIILGLITVFNAVKIKDPVVGMSFLFGMLVLLIICWIASYFWTRRVFRNRIKRLNRVKTAILVDWTQYVPNSGIGLHVIQKQGPDYEEVFIESFMAEQKDMKNCTDGEIINIYTDGKLFFVGTK